MSKCPVCGTENAPDLTVCDFCGSDLLEEKNATAPDGVHMYYVGIDDIGNDRTAVIQVVQELNNCTFEEAREKIDGDGIVLTEVPKIEAEIAVSKLRGAGATATMEDLDYDGAEEFLSDDDSSSATPNTPASAPASDSFFDNPNYGIIAIVCTIFLGWIGLVMAILGMTKSTNEDVRKKCKIAVILGIVLVVLSVVIGIIYGVVLGAAASSGAIDPSAMPVYGSCLGGF